MEPVKRSTHNLTYVGEREEGGRIVNEGVGDLSCERRDGGVVSHWRPDSIELEVLRMGGAIELTVQQEPLPPLSLGVVGPEEGEVSDRMQAAIPLVDAIAALARELFRVEWWRVEGLDSSGDFKQAPRETRDHFDERAAGAFGLSLSAYRAMCPIEMPDTDDPCTCGHVCHEHHYGPDPECGPDVGACAHCDCSKFTPAES